MNYLLNSDISFILILIIIALLAYLILSNQKLVSKLRSTKKVPRLFWKLLYILIAIIVGAIGFTWILAALFMR